jgi:hypothetical protein
MARLPAVLGTDDLPLAELCAARLDGELVLVGTGWCPVDEPDLPSLRAAAVAPRLPAPLIVERGSAAWVHGAVPLPPSVVECCVPHDERVAARTDPTRTVREVVITDAEIVEVGGIRCTSIERTAFDLLRDATADDGSVIDAVRGLVASSPRAADRVHDRIRSAHRLPHKALALRRLADALAVADVGAPA